MSFIKRLSILLTAALMILSLAACTGESSDKPAQPSPTEQTSVTAQASGQPQESDATAQASGQPQESAAGETADDSQLEDVYSTLDTLEDAVNGLDDVAEGDLDIPNP